MSELTEAEIVAEARGDGPTNTFPCKKCGAKIERYRGESDVNCERCGQCHNAFGQQIDYPYGRGEDYAGERWDDDY